MGLPANYLPRELYITSLFDDANLQSYWRLEGDASPAKGATTGTATTTSTTDPIMSPATGAS